MMRKLILLSVVALAIPVVTMAQDDMYFVPTKDNVAKSAYNYGMPRETYYSGSDRDIDEYNRRGSQVQLIDSIGNDIVEFDSVMETYPDSVTSEQSDYTYTRRMSRFDDYEWADPYWAGYYDGRSSRWGWYGWYDPWYYGGWYAGWYDPWYYGWHYNPWLYGWGGWYGGWYGHHWWGGPSYVAYHKGPTGTFNHVNGTGRRPLSGYGANTVSNGISNRDRIRNTGLRNRTFNASERFGTNRNTNTTVRNNTPVRNNSSFSTGGFGGSRSGGSFSGGSRSGGGGSRGGFGGRR